MIPLPGTIAWTWMAPPGWYSDFMVFQTRSHAIHVIQGVPTLFLQVNRHRIATHHMATETLRTTQNTRVLVRRTRSAPHARHRDATTPGCTGDCPPPRRWQRSWRRWKHWLRPRRRGPQERGLGSRRSSVSNVACCCCCCCSSSSSSSSQSRENSMLKFFVPADQRQPSGTHTHTHIYIYI